jgi:uncharacterized protein YgfB (UPF0149 family)
MDSIDEDEERKKEEERKEDEHMMECVRILAMMLGFGG